MLELIRVMGRLGIEVLCYNWMAVVTWSRTSVALPGRGGAEVTGFDEAVWRDGPPAPGAPVDEEQLWESLAWFLERAVPVAEQAGVKLALHPDDPPLSPLRGIARIICSLDAYERVFELQPSAANGMTMCQGNVALMTDDLPAAIRRFGAAGRIHFVHFRDVRGTPERFVETFIDEGPTDMAACIRAYLDAGRRRAAPYRPLAVAERRQDGGGRLSDPGPPARDRLRAGPNRGRRSMTRPKSLSTLRSRIAGYGLEKSNPLCVDHLEFCRQMVYCARLEIRKIAMSKMPTTHPVISAATPVAAASTCVSSTAAGLRFDGTALSERPVR